MRFPVIPSFKTAMWSRPPVCQAAREKIGPASILVGCGTDTVGYGIAYSDNGRSSPIDNIDTGQKVPLKCGGRSGQICSVGEIAGHLCEVICLLRYEVRCVSHRKSRQVNAYGQIGP